MNGFFNRVRSIRSSTSNASIRSAKSSAQLREGNNVSERRKAPNRRRSQRHLHEQADRESDMMRGAQIAWNRVQAFDQKHPRRSAVAHSHPSELDIVHEDAPVDFRVPQTALNEMSPEPDKAELEGDHANRKLSASRSQISGMQAIPPIPELPGNGPRMKGLSDIINDEMHMNTSRPRSMGTVSTRAPSSLSKGAVSIPTRSDVALRTISMDILSAAREYPGLRGTSTDAPEAAVRQLLGEYRKIVTLHNEQYQEQVVNNLSMITNTARHYPALEGIPEDDLAGAINRLIYEYKELAQAYHSQTNSTVTANIPRMIIDASKRYPALQGLSMEDPDGAVRHLLETYQSLVHLHLKTKKDLERHQIMDSKCGHLEKALQDSHDKIAKNEKTRESDRAKIRFFEQRTESDAKKMADLDGEKRRLEKAHRKITDSNNDLQKKYADMKFTQDSTMAKLRHTRETKNELQKVCDGLKDEDKSKLAQMYGELTKEHQKTKDSYNELQKRNDILQKEHNSKIAKLHAEFDGKYRQMKTSKNDLQKRNDDLHGKTNDAHKFEVARLRQLLEKEQQQTRDSKNDLQKSHEDIYAGLKQKHKAELADMREKLEGQHTESIRVLSNNHRAAMKAMQQKSVAAKATRESVPSSHGARVSVEERILPSRNAAGSHPFLRGL